MKDIQSALQWTTAAMVLLDEGEFSLYEKRSWKFELEHRLARLQSKIV